MTRRHCQRGRIRAAGVVAGFCAAVLVASCGAVEKAMSDDEASVREGVVVVLAPAGTVDGEGVREAVERAISETTSDIGGWTVEVRLVDDDVDDLGELADEIVDDDVIAVIGGLSTETIRAVQPTFSAESLLFVSPADTVPEHTRGADAGNPLRPYANYYRTSMSAEQPLQALARYAVDALEVSTVATVDAGGAGAEVSAFAAAVVEAGGEVVPIKGAATPADVAPMLSTATDAEAGAVFVAGRADVAAATADEVAGRGVDMELLGGSVVNAEDFLAEAGSSAEGAWTAVAGELVSSADQVAGAASEQMADVGVTSPGRYGAEAYDAGLAVGTVLTGCLPSASSATSARQGCTGEMAQISVTGVTGDVAFDAFGDRAGASPAVMVVRGGTWTPVEPSQ